MLKSIALIPSILGFVIIISIVICKYFNIPQIFFLIIIFISILYYNNNKKNNKNINFEETIINFSKFLIVSGILGYVVARIIGLFFSGFD
jgi:TctA family transporter